MTLTESDVSAYSVQYKHRASQTMANLVHEDEWMEELHAREQGRVMQSSAARPSHWQHTLTLADRRRGGQNGKGVRKNVDPKMARIRAQKAAQARWAK